MAAKELGDNVLPSSEELESLFSRWAVYLTRSSRDLAEAFRLSPTRVRSLFPAYVHQAIEVANAAAYQADEGLLDLANELATASQGCEDPVYGTVLQCALANARRRCGDSRGFEQALAKLEKLAEAEGGSAATETLLRCGRVVGSATLYPDEALLALLHEVGPDAFSQVFRDRKLRFRLDEPLPLEHAPCIAPLLEAMNPGFHPLLHPNARAEASPAQIAKAIAKSAPRIAALLYLAAGDEASARDLSRGRGALSEWPLEITTQMLHFEGFVAYVVPRREALAKLVAAPGEKAALAALSSLELPPKGADRALNDATKTIVAHSSLDPDWGRPRALSLVVNLALHKGRLVAARRAASKMSKHWREESLLLVASAYAKAGDAGGAAATVLKIVPNNHRFPQTNPVALAALRALVTGPGAS